MAIDVEDLTLRLVRKADGLDLDLQPLQGLWTEAQYLKLTDQTKHLIEFTDGVIEALPTPTSEHQMILAFLYRRLFPIIQALGGIVLFSPLRLQIRPGKYREPDLVVLLDKEDPRFANAFWSGADLVVEIVSPDKPQRDLEDKPVDFAEAGIPEYWIVNPIVRTIRVLKLVCDQYVVHGVFQPGSRATSPVLPDFGVDVEAVFSGA